MGASLDKADKQAMQRTTSHALENNRSGTTSTWDNPDTGHRGSVTPTETYQSADGQYCREFTTSVTVEGKREKAKGTACRQPDGTWRIVQ